MNMTENIHNPKLSIVIPFYNKKEMVGLMIDSILSNDFKDWELLAVDDGSDEETVIYLSHYWNDKRIHYIRREQMPKGAPTCRNIGQQLAKGEYIIFFDSDDYITPRCLSTRVESIEARPSLDFMVFPSGQYHNGTIPADNLSQTFGYKVYKDDFKAFLERTLPFIVVNNIYRKKALTDHHITWDTTLRSLQDSDFNMQAILCDLCYDYAKKPADYGYRIEGNNTSISKKISSEEHRQSHLYFLNKQYEAVQKKYGKRYNQSLYRSVLYIYSFVMSTGIDAAYARKLADIVSRHDRFRGRLLNAKIRMSELLGKFLPLKLARQLPMPCYLIRRWWMEKQLPMRIIKVREQT